MNLSIPILICDENDEIRRLQKDMLTKHGYFHLVEAHSSEETLQLLSQEQFILIHKNLVNDRVKRALEQHPRFLIVAQSEQPETMQLAAYFGVKHVISFPYSSRSLVEKIDSLI